MTFEDYWDRMTRATPQLLDDEAVMRIGVPAFKAEMQKAYRAGAKHAGDEPLDYAPESGWIMDVFRDIFGGRK